MFSQSQFLVALIFSILSVTLSDQSFCQNSDIDLLTGVFANELRETKAILTYDTRNFIELCKNENQVTYNAVGQVVPDLNEWLNVIEKVYWSTDSTLQSLLELKEFQKAKIDVNGDGKITKCEYLYKIMKVRELLGALAYGATYLNLRNSTYRVLLQKDFSYMNKQCQDLQSRLTAQIVDLDRIVTLCL